MLNFATELQLLSRIVLLGLVLAVVGGCGPLLTLHTKLATECNAQNSGATDTANVLCEPADSDTKARLLAHEYGLFALFAEVVYRRDLPESEREGRGCEYLNSDREEDFGMPISTSGEWKRWIRMSGTEDSVPGVERCHTGGGLYYETYVYYPNEEPKKASQVVIAFRGTENYAFRQALADWRTNLSAAFGFQPRQYSTAVRLIPKVIEQMKAEFGDVPLYAVGHSLGGGLAQQAGYLSSRVTEVVTFNTSPVTNWTWLRRNKLVQNEYPTISRVFHSGEILEKARFVTTNFTSARYGRYDVAVQFEDRSNGKGHAMAVLACRFAEIISKQPESYETPHGLSSLFVADKVLGDHRLCPDG